MWKIIMYKKLFQNKIQKFKRKIKIIYKLDHKVLVIFREKIQIRS
jgi:hypothetical protein